MIGLDIALPFAEWPSPLEEGRGKDREEASLKTLLTALRRAASFSRPRFACRGRVTGLFSLGLIPQ